MNKSELINTVTNKTGLTIAQCTKALDAIFNEIQDQVAAGQQVTIHRFGIFFAAERAERLGRNPKTGEEITIPASKAPAFKASSAFKELLKG